MEQRASDFWWLGLARACTISECSGRPQMTTRKATASALAISWAMTLGMLTFSTHAFACVAPGSRASVFFDEAPPGRPTQVVAQVTVIQRLPPLRDRAVPSFEGLARVDKVISGSIERQVIKLVTDASDCTMAFDVGQSGIVAGRLVVDSQGMLELRAIPETMQAKWNRRMDKAK